MKNFEFNLNIDNKRYQSKPNGDAMSGIKNRLSNLSNQITMCDLAKAIENGQSFTPAELNGTKAEDFISQKVFCVDIDNSYYSSTIKTITIDDAISICSDAIVPISFIYYSFSHTEEIPKFRIVFQSDEVITDKEKASHISKALISLFQQEPYMSKDVYTLNKKGEEILQNKLCYQVDTSCHNVDRVFFGTNKGIYPNKELQPNACFAHDFLIARYDCNCFYNNAKIEVNLGGEDCSPPNSTVLNNNNVNIDIAYEYKNFDLINYIRSNFNIENEKTSGNMIKINPCPICGHNDDFYIYLNTNTFCCYSTNNSTNDRLAGNIHTFIRYTKNLDDKQAREHILYDLLRYERQSYQSKSMKPNKSGYNTTCGCGASYNGLDSGFVCPNCGIGNQDSLETYQNNSYNENVVPELKIIDADELMKQEFPPLQFAVDEILPQGIFLLSAPPKIGKSWLMLDICVAIASGTPFWNYNVTQGKALYLALEDNQERIQRRLHQISDDTNFSNNLKFVTGFDGDVKGLADGVVAQILKQLNTYSDTRLIVIDTLGMIRNTDNTKKAVYNADVDDIKLIREITNKYNVSIVLVHHTRKQGATDPMEKISGSYGLTGTTDGNWVLDKPNRFADEANLYIDNRDTTQFAFKLEFDPSTCKWDFIEHLQKCEYTQIQNDLGLILNEFMCNNENEFKGTAQELCVALEKFDIKFNELKLNYLTISKQMVKIVSLLKEKYFIEYKQERSKKARFIILQKDNIQNEVSEEVTTNLNEITDILEQQGISSDEKFMYSSETGVITAL